MSTHPADVRAVALLAEPVRRDLYEWVVAAPGPVAKDEAAAALGITRALATFHLDRLVAAGLLAADYRRRSGRTGPGAGRPAKLYRRAEGEVVVSVPDRRYERAAGVLASAVERLSIDRPPDELIGAARSAGHVAAEAEPNAPPGRRSSRRRSRARLIAALRGQGYMPREAADGSITLANCPFSALVEDHRQVVCGMNLALAEGMLEVIEGTGVTPRLDPDPTRCCVVFVPVAGRIA